MLVKFKVKNFKSFNDEFVFDLTKTKNYEFSKNSIHSHVASKAMIYGENGCGKSNLTLAIFDIVNHLKDDQTPKDYIENYLNAENTSDIAEFEYSFKFQEYDIVYKYTKRSSNIIVLEVLTVNGLEVLSIDRNKSSDAKVSLKGTETLKTSLENSNVSLLKYVMNNSLLTVNATNSAIRTMMNFIEYMTNSLNIYSADSGFKNRESWDHAIINEGIDKFQSFINEMGVKCKLGSRKINGVETIVFDYGENYIEFSKAASTGTKSLYALYISIYKFNLIKVIIDSRNRAYDSSVEILDKGNELIEIFEESKKKGHFTKELRLEEKRNNKRMSDNELPFDEHRFIPFLLIDEFDAFFHYKASKKVIDKLKDMDIQLILTTHNTSIMTNDLLRPDCYFIMEQNEATPIYKYTDKELREAHNIEKMFRAGAFDG